MYKKSRTRRRVVYGAVIMNHLNEQRINYFKTWIRKRFLSEVDYHFLPAVEALAWSAALKELSQEVSHEVVPFDRAQGDR